MVQKISTGFQIQNFINFDYKKLLDNKIKNGKMYKQYILQRSFAQNLTKDKIYLLFKIKNNHHQYLIGESKEKLLPPLSYRLFYT